ncbi:class I SAM-dependent methyltransferase [Streptomyces omiyaensis]|uniref:Class I SAM-dependent methyltransferase n=1 Tax=Streptomyces omiyaensis TaxID=68247 RepID=A0ABW7C078_9ACTN
MAERLGAAVAGAGGAGLTAGHVLASSYEVTPYEADGRLGGHARTRGLSGPGGQGLAVDSGFIVHDEPTHPPLLRSFREPGIGAQGAETSMSVGCDGCGLEHAGARLLQIGTGWGELALRAAARGARVTALPLSGEQAVLARERTAAAGLADRVEVQPRGHRDVGGRCDAVISVETIEAVGAEYRPSSFTALRRALAPGGRIAPRAITMGHREMLPSAATHTPLSTYVFPGGLIPSREAIAEHSAASGPATTADDGYGEHDAETLRRGRERFTAHRPVVTALGFAPVFPRMGEFHPACSEAGFRSRHLDVRQLLLTEGTHR